VKIILDTCVIVWAVSDPEHIPDLARSVLTDDDTEVYVSPISCAEIACAARRGRIELDRHWRTWFRFSVERNGWAVFDIDLITVEEAYSLPDEFHSDPADRIIVASARRLDCPVLTADRKIIEYPHVETIWRVG